MSSTSLRSARLPDLARSPDWTRQTLKQTTLRRILRRKAVIFSFVVVIIAVLLTVFADHIAPFTDHQMGTLINAPAGTPDPTSQHIHWMGTDNLGRDIFSRLLSGARISLAVGFAADALITLIGVAVGLTAGYFGGAVD